MKTKNIVSALENLLKHQPSVTGNTPAQVNAVWAQRIQRVLDTYGTKPALLVKPGMPRPANWCVYEKYTEADGSVNHWPSKEIIAGKTVNVFTRPRPANLRAEWDYHSTVRAYRAKDVQKKLNALGFNVLISPNRTP